MRARWNRDGRSDADWARADLAARTRDLPLRQRADMVLWSAIALALALVFGTLVFGLLLGKRVRWWEPPLLRPIADARILSNVQEQIRSQPIVDAVAHLGDTFILRQDGQVLRYQPSTELWSEQKPFEEASIRLTRLRSDAGDGSGDPSLWGLTTGEGLARRTDGTWRMLFSNTAFTALNGRPFTNDDLTCAAVSEDRIWLLVGTRFDGVGLYHIPDRTWLTRTPGEFAYRFNEPVSHAAWYRGRFYFGTNAGFHWIDPLTTRGETLAPELALIDLDAAPEGLWILGRRARPSGQFLIKKPPIASAPATDEGAQGEGEQPEVQLFDALYFARLTEPDQSPQILLEETALFPELNQSDLIFACEKRGKLIVAGRGGIYSYDIGDHRWQRHHDRPVRHAFTAGVTSPVYFSGPGEVGAFDGANPLTWALPGEDIIQLDALPSGRVLATTRSGGLYGLSHKEPPETLRYNRSSADTKFTQGVAQGDDLLLIGPEGGILHNTAKRTYAEIPKKSIPAWFQEPKTELLLADGSLHAFRPTANSTELYSWPNSGGQIQINPAAAPVPIPSPRNHPIAWGSQGFLYIGGDGQVLAYKKGVQQVLVGPANAALNGQRMIDVASWEGDLVLATESGLVIYDRGARTFGNLMPAQKGETTVELANLDKVLLRRTERGRLLIHPWRNKPEQSQGLIGGSLAFPFTQSQISDVFSQHHALFLAGEGRIAQYDLAERRITWLWDTSSDQPVKLLGFQQYPISLVDGALYRGASKIDPDAGRVSAAVMSNERLLAAYPRPEGIAIKTYLEGVKFNPEAALTSYGYPSTGPGATQIQSVAHFRDRFFCATNAGLRIYDTRQHNWYQGPKDLLASGGQIYLLDDTLFLVDRQDAQHQRVHILDFQSVLAHNDSNLVMPLKTTSFTVRSFALSPGREAAWLRDDGTLERWRHGKTETLFSPTGNTPSSGSLQCVFRSSDKERLHFAAVNELWSYHCTKRQWTRTPLVYEGRPFVAAHIELESGPDGPMVNARRGDGALFSAQLDPDAVEIAMIFLAAPPRAYFEAGFQLVDVQGRPNALWAFVFTDRIGYYDPHGRQWVGEQRLPIGTRQVTLAQSAGLDIIQADTGWLIAQDYKAVPGGYVLPSRFAAYSPEPGDQTAIDSNRQIWRLTPTGLLLRGRNQNGTYNFTHMAGPAPAISPERVRQAFDWGALRLLELHDRLMLLDTESDSELPLGVAQGLLGINQAHSVGDELWLISDAGLVRLHREQGGGVSTKIQAGVSRVALDANGTPWGLIGGVWQVWKEGAFVRPWSTASKAPWQGQELFVNEGAQVTTLDAAGVPYYWNHGFVAGGVPLEPTLRGDIVALFRGRQNDWWTVSAGTLLHLTAGPCTLGGRKATCLIASARLALPQTFRSPLAWTAVAVDGRNRLVLAAGKSRIEIAVEGDHLRLTESVSGKPSALLADIWPKLRKSLAADRTGQFRLNPITALRTDRTGRLVAVRASGEQLLASRGDVALQQPKPLDCSWLRWDRDKRVFSVRTDQGNREYRPQQFVRDGHLLFEDIAAITFDERGLHAANQTGIWSFPEDSLAVDDPRVNLVLVDLGDDIQAAHGQFVTANGRFDSTGKPTKFRANEIAINDLVLSETAAGITASIDHGRKPIAALAEHGFVWDSSRLAIAYDGERLLIQSPLGFQPTEGLFSFMPGPVPGLTGRPQTAPDGSLHLDLAGSWWRLQEGLWQPATDPSGTLPLYEDKHWSWRTNRGQIRVSYRGKSLPISEDEAGLSFARDRISEALLASSAMALTTAAGLRLINTNDPQETAYTLKAGESLAVLPDDAGNTDIYRLRGAEVARWDGSGFTPSTLDPNRRRIVLQLPSFRVHQSARGIGFDIVQETPDGQTIWQPLRISEGIFPFDRVTALATAGKQLFVGTPIGLQVYSASTRVALTERLRFLDLRARPDAPPASVTRIGIPADGSAMLVKSTGVGLERNLEGELRVSERAQSLGARKRVEDPFWRWSQQEDGKLIGAYDDGSGAYASPPIDLEGGRLPHDRLADLAFWGGNTYALWDNGWVTQSPGSGLVLGKKIRHFNLAQFWPSGFAQAPNKSGDMALYLKAKDGSVLQRVDQGWAASGDPLAQQQLAELVGNPPIYLRGRLRMLREAPLRFEYQDDGGQWQELAWQEGRVTIDHWRGLVNIGQTTWAATPKGLLRLVERNRALVLDPERFQLCADWSEAALGGPITDLRSTGKNLTVRVADDGTRVFQAALDGKGLPTAPQKREGKDPFESRQWIGKDSAGRWVWELIGRARGRAGSMRVTKDGEVVNLLAGRFDFDTVNSVALANDSLLDFCTDQGGWYRAPRERFDVGQIKRARLLDVEPTAFDRIGLGYDDRGKVLALHRRDGNTLTVGKGAPREVQGASEFLGEDPLWRYFRGEQGLTAVGHDGLGQRAMIEGRFTDDIVQGFPQRDSKHTWIPTRAGVQVLDHKLVPERLLTAPFAGLGGEQTPSVLLRYQGKLLYAGEDAFHDLAEPRSVVAGLGIAAPDGYELERVAALPEGGYQAQWRSYNRRGFTRLRAKDLVTYPANQLYIDIADLEDFISHRLAWGNPNPWLTFDFSVATPTVASTGCTVPLLLPDHFALVNMIRKDKHLYLIGEHHLLELDLEVLARRLFSVQAQKAN